MRECSKVGCRGPAVATAAMRYRDRLVWVGDLLPDRDPNLLDLCDEHAGRITAPRGWTLRLECRIGTEPASIGPSVGLAAG